MNKFRRLVPFLVLASAATACERSPAEPALEIHFESPAPGTSITSRSVTITGTVVNATSPTVSYAVNGGAFMPAAMSFGVPNGFEVALTDLPIGPTTVTVQASDGSRTVSKGVTFDIVLPVATITLDTLPPAAGVPHRTWAFSGQVSEPGVVVRYSLNGGAERAVQQYPPLAGSGGGGTFRAEAHSLVNGSNTVELRAYLGADRVGTRSVSIDASVASQRYAIASVIEVAGSKSFSGIRLGNDGRLAGYWVDATDVTHVFTWAGGTLTQLDGMRMFFDLNNVGQVLGVEASSQTSVVWRSGVYTVLTDFPGASMINDHGHLGQSLRAGYWNGTAFVAYPQTGLVSLSSLNNHGAMAGLVYTMNGAHPAPVVWLDATQYTFSLGPLYRYGSAFRIGDSGHVLVGGVTSSTLSEFAGNRSLVWHADAVTDLSSRIGLQTRAVDVNAQGVIAGSYSLNGGPAAFTWLDGRMTDVKLASDEWTIVRVSAIDDAGRLAVEGKRTADGTLAVLLLAPG